MIKIIIFDLGGILVPEKRESILNGVSDYVGLSHRKILASFKNNSQTLIMGKMTLYEFYTALITNFDLKTTPKLILEKHLELYSTYGTKRNKSIISLINKLKEKYHIAALTNTEIEIAKYNRENGLFNIFDSTFLSTEMYLMKPQREIYIKTLERLQCNPGEVIFIDDNPQNINPAETLGINSILYKNNKQLKNDLINILT